MERNKRVRGFPVSNIVHIGVWVVGKEADKFPSGHVEFAIPRGIPSKCLQTWSS